MDRTFAALLMVVFLLVPSPAFADEGDPYGDSREHSLQTAEAYRGIATTLENGVGEFGYRLQWIVTELIDICYDLSDTKIELAEAIGASDWYREEKLKLKYIALTAEEERLWDEFERSTQ